MKASACPAVGSKMSPRGDALVPPGFAGAELEHVVVVEVHAAGARLRQLADGALGGHRRPHGAPEDVGPLHPTVQMPNENRSSGVGTKRSAVMVRVLSLPRLVICLFETFSKSLSYWQRRTDPPGC